MCSSRAHRAPRPRGAALPQPNGAVLAAHRAPHAGANGWRQFWRAVLRARAWQIEKHPHRRTTTATATPSACPRPAVPPSLQGGGSTSWIPRGSSAKGGRATTGFHDKRSFAKNHYLGANATYPRVRVV